MWNIINLLCFQGKAGLFWLFWAFLKIVSKLCLWLSFSSSPSLQNAKNLMRGSTVNSACLREQRWLVSCPCGVNLLTNQLRSFKKIKQQQPKFFDNNRRSKINMKFHLKFWRETNNFQTTIFWACVSYQGRKKRMGNLYFSTLAIIEKNGRRVR